MASPFYTARYTAGSFTRVFQTKLQFSWNLNLVPKKISGRISPRVLRICEHNTSVYERAYLSVLLCFGCLHDQHHLSLTVCRLLFHLSFLFVHYPRLDSYNSQVCCTFFNLGKQRPWSNLTFMPFLFFKELYHLGMNVSMKKKYNVFSVVL